MKNSFSIDVHCHLQDEKYQNMNIEKIIKEGREKKVSYIIVSGYDLNSNIKAIELSKKYDNIFATVGFHPSEAENKNNLKILEKQLQSDKVVALGEIGLDYHYDVNREKQKELFIEQIKIANIYNKPIVIHSRDSIDDTYTILKKYKENKIKGLLHCYSSNYEMAKKFIKINMVFSISGVVTFKNNIKTKEFVKNCPLKYLLVETDSPYLTPEPNRGKINFPGNIFHIVNEIAKLKNKDSNEVENITTRNAITLFDLKI